MKAAAVKLLFFLLAAAPALAQLPTLYEYFSEGGINEGLDPARRETFTLNGKDIKILSGSLHYFRVHPDYW